MMIVTIVLKDKSHHLMSKVVTKTVPDDNLNKDTDND